MAPQPVVTGLSPKEGPPGTRVIIRGEFLGIKPTDLIGKRNVKLGKSIALNENFLIQRFKNLWFRLFAIGRMGVNQQNYCPYRTGKRRR